MLVRIRCVAVWPVCLTDRSRRLRSRGHTGPIMCVYIDPLIDVLTLSNYVLYTCEFIFVSGALVTYCGMAQRERSVCLLSDHCIAHWGKFLLLHQSLNFI